MLALCNSLQCNDEPMNTSSPAIFHAVAYQLDSIGVQNVDAQTLRKMAVSYLRENSCVSSVHYKALLLEPVASGDNDAYTETTNDEDVRRSAIVDPEIQPEQRWVRYL